MISIEPIAARIAQPPISEAAVDPTPPLLPAPTTVELEPNDALGLMLALMERMGHLSTSHTEKRIRVNQEQMQETLDEFLRKLAEAIEAARRAAEAEEDDGGIFSDIGDFVSDVVGTVVGTVVDFVKDAVEAPFEVTEGLIKNLDDPQGFLSVMKAQVIELSSNGETAATVKGFTRGLTKFAADLTDFSARFAAALAKGLDPEAAWESVKADAERLWKSFQSNILENPDFMEVATAIAKAAAVAGAVVSGGTLAWVAIALFVVCEADNRYGFVEDVVGKEAAPWVRLGMQIAATALLAGAAASGEGQTVLNWIKAGTAIVGGASEINASVRQLVEAERRADELERQADIQQTLNRLHQLQRLLDSLLELLEEQTEDRRTNVDVGNRIVQTQAATESATVVRG